MFFEDEKENLENLDNLDDLDLDLSEDGDDESISWDELLKDTPTDISDDDIISITAPAAEAKSSAKSANAKPKKPAGTKKTESSPAKKAAKEDDILAADTAGAAKSTPKQDAFDVFGGDKQSKGAIDADDLSDESESVLDELDGMDEMDDVDDDELKNIGIKADKRNNTPMLAGILFAIVLVVGSIVYMFLAPKANAPVANVNQVQQNVAQNNAAAQKEEAAQPRDAVKVAGENDEAIPVVDDKEAKNLKADKKVVVPVESAGRVNPFVPTFDDFNGNYYAGLPAQVLMPPDQYGNDLDAQGLLEVSVSGILFDSVKPSAIVTINSMDYFVQTGDTVDDYMILDINRQNVVIKKGTNIYKAGVGERFSQNMSVAGAAVYNANGTRHYSSQPDGYASASDVEVRAIGQN